MNLYPGNIINGGGGSRKDVRKAMILAAGLGTRLKPWTDKHPKALAIVNGKTLLQRNVEYLQQAGIKEVVVNVHHFHEQVRAAIESNNGWGSNISISDESSAVLETGGGLLHAAHLLKGEDPFVVINVDILTNMNLSSMINYHQEKKPLVTLATSTRATSRYLLFDDGNNLCGWRNINNVEEKTVSPLSKEALANVKQRAFSGIHIIDPEIFNHIKQEGKFSIIDVYMDLMKTHTIKSFEDNESQFIDVGKPESIAKAEAIFGSVK